MSDKVVKKRSQSIFVGVRNSFKSSKTIAVDDELDAIDLLEKVIAEDPDEEMEIQELLKEKYDIRITNTELFKDKRGDKSYTVYVVQVTRDVSTWIVKRRYSQFHSLNQHLKKKFDNVPKKFPGKRFMQNLSPHYIEKRHVKLQTWLTNVLNKKILREYDKVHAFVNDDKYEVAFVPRRYANVQKYIKSIYTSDVITVIVYFSHVDM
eukprot:TRINITY_DN5748_c0_g1_i2.p1 TRINITY_DN5748_c0_g1~~TRINITY_DN5748_c0_g1_i2.p1  ORF type:complete len:207 (+),score=37.56 TRINITY_DN5748_c0_g1_i2:33-653(+)